MRPTWTWSPLFVVALLPLGCGGPVPRTEVAGTVRAKDRPLANVLVTFVPDNDPGGKRAAGVTDGQGRFCLKSPDGLVGVPVGSYRVVIEDLNIYDAPRSPDGTLLKAAANRVPAKYRDALQTPLRQQIHNATPLDVTYPLAP